MQRKTSLAELLAPAGGEEALYAALSSGADAVYLGGRYSARAQARNFDEAALADAVSYAHLCGKRVYIALNTLLFDRELSDFLSYAERVAATGVDAAIVADMGALSLLARHLPALPLHASTQAFIHSTATADLVASLGATRVVAARELSLSALTALTASCRAEVEVFLHGALCVSHSGQCLFSSLVGGRSGNRGECAQPCRLPYGGGYPLSLRDLSLAAHIPALLRAGVSSLKIEGRMKSPAYVAGVTAIYRRLLDEGRAATREEQEELASLFSRGGFTDGYFLGKHGVPMTGIRSEADKAASRKQEEGQVSFTKKEISVEISATLRLGVPAEMTIRRGERSVTVRGDTPLPATSAPLRREEVAARLCRLGGTGLAASTCALSLEDGVFLTVGQQNALRRAAVAAFLAAGGEARGLSYGGAPRLPAEGPRRVAVAYRTPLARCAEESGFFGRVYLSLPHAVRDGYFPKGVVLPPVILDSEEEEILGMLYTAAAAGSEYALCQSYGAIALSRRAGLIPVGGYRLNITNKESAAALSRLGVCDYTLSPELSAPRVRDIGGRLIVYGRLPLMLTERCFIKENFGCARCESAYLTDRRGARFPLMREYPHRNLVLNSLVTYLADRPALLAAAGEPKETYLFTNETEGECRAVLAAAKAGLPLAGQVRRLCN